MGRSAFMILAALSAGAASAAVLTGKAACGGWTSDDAGGVIWRAAYAKAAKP